MKFLVLLSCFLVTVAHGSGWCNEPSFQKYSINSPLLFSCDDSQLKNKIAELQQEVEENSRTLSQLGQTCDTSAIQAEISLLRREIKSLIGGTPIGSLSNPALSCSEVEADIGTGRYYLSANNTIVNVTCDYDVQLPPLCPVRGWQEVANLDVSNPTHSCPDGYRDTTVRNIRRCWRNYEEGGGCDSLFFPTSGVPFTKLCGRIIGFGIGLLDALLPHFVSSGEAAGINDPYIDGVSITYGPSDNRTHIWSLAADIPGPSRCPCGDGPSTPDFVGEHYYCETYVNADSMLWDGEGCTLGSTNDGDCCANPNLPWFCREFDEPVTTDNIEVRICTDERRHSEDVLFSMIKLFIH